MSIYKIVNVGQGDCIVISPPKKCIYEDEKFFVDLGSGKTDISQCVDRNQSISIFLTHFHNDHIGGLRRFASSLDRVNKIYLPLYQNEVVLIAKAILKMKAIRSAVNCDDLIEQLQAIIENQLLLKRRRKPRIVYAWDRLNVCKHIKCLNPTLNRFQPISVFEREALKEIASELFEQDFANDFKAYIDANGRVNNLENDENIANRIWIVGSDRMGYETGSEGLSFVNSFFTNNYSILRDFNSTGDRDTLEAIVKEHSKSSHDVCTVLKINYGNRSILLTGDATKAVFYRLINNNVDISADYLKLPHHGSEENIDEKILNAINPDVYIISHNNRKFGKQKDAHPNQSVIDMLHSNCYLMLTNDVIKDGEMVISREYNSIDPYGFVEIVDI